MKGIVKGNTIVFEEDVPKLFSDGDKVEVTIKMTTKDKYSFPTFPFSVNEDELQRERIYEKD